MVEHGALRGALFNDGAGPDATLLPFPRGLRVGLVDDVVIEAVEFRGGLAADQGDEAAGLIFRSIPSILALRVDSASSLMSPFAEIPWHRTAARCLRTSTNSAVELLPRFDPSPPHLLLQVGPFLVVPMPQPRHRIAQRVNSKGTSGCIALDEKNVASLGIADQRSGGRRRRSRACGSA
jgi:hypothetical protein